MLAPLSRYRRPVRVGEPRTPITQILRGAPASDRLKAESALRTAGCRDAADQHAIHVCNTSAEVRPFTPTPHRARADEGRGVRPIRHREGLKIGRASIARLGNVLYWASCLFAVLILAAGWINYQGIDATGIEEARRSGVADASILQQQMSRPPRTPKPSKRPQKQAIHLPRF